MVQDVFDRLRNLQEILSKKFEIEKELQELPRALSTKMELLNRMKKTYIEKNDQFLEMKEKIRSLRDRMFEAEHQREDYEKQMDIIKTQREYEALEKEIRDASEKEQQFRKELQREEKTFDDMSHALEREESMIKQQEDELTAEQENIKQETTKRQEILNELGNEESTIVPGLDEEMVFKFERIIRSKSGLGIVAIRKGVCMGCHMVLPNQFVNDVRSGEDILFCPYCSRILFYQADEDDGFFQDIDADNLGELEDFEMEDEEYEDDNDDEDIDEDFSEESSGGVEEE